MAFNRLGIIGAGAWGTALAQTQSRNFQTVRLWSYEEETARNINTSHCNSIFLPDIPLSGNIEAVTRLEEMADCDLVLLVTPAQTIRATSEKLVNIFPASVPVVLCSKGIEKKTGLLLTQILEKTMPDHEVGVLSGPSFAKEVAEGKPTAITLACHHQKTGMEMISALGHKAFRPYWSDDLVGAEIGGAIKNVLAIAAGIVEGKQLGAGAHAALITRGFHELTRLGEALGGKRDTLRGLSGLGDLVLTCSNRLSRNMSLGVALGEGRPLADILAERQAVTEGVFTASAVMTLTRSRSVEMPICTAVYRIIEKQISIDEAINSLLSRPYRQENA